MPYFERKPYADTIAATADMMGKSPPDAPPEPNIVDLATSVLGDGAQTAAHQEGPFRARNPVDPGQVASLTLEIAADTSDGDVMIAFSASDLTGENGVRIPSHMITLTPHHLRLTPGDEDIDIKIEVAVPNGTAPGIYAGRISGQGAEPVTILVEVEVSG